MYTISKTNGDETIKNNNESSNSQLFLIIKSIDENDEEKNEKNTENSNKFCCNCCFLCHYLGCKYKSKLSYKQTFILVVSVILIVILVIVFLIFAIIPVDYVPHIIKPLTTAQATSMCIVITVCV